MKNILFISILILSISCKMDKASSKAEKKKKQVKITSIEKFKEVDFLELKNKLSKQSKDLSPIEIMNLFYQHKVGDEGKESIVSTEKILKNGNQQIILIHDNQMDDSVKGIKYIMELKKQNNLWNVISIKSNWKCWQGRGHKEWGIELCN